MWVGVCPCACDGGAPARGRCRGIARRARGAAAAGAEGSKGGSALRPSASALLLNHHIHQACRESADARKYGRRRRRRAVVAGTAGRLLHAGSCRWQCSAVLCCRVRQARRTRGELARGPRASGSRQRANDAELATGSMSTLPTKPWRACGPGLGWSSSGTALGPASPPAGLRIAQLVGTAAPITGAMGREEGRAGMGPANLKTNSRPQLRAARQLLARSWARAPSATASLRAA